MNKSDFKAEEVLAEADKLFHAQYFSKALEKYRLIIDSPGIEQVHVLKNMSLSHAALNNPTAAVKYIKKYLLKEFNTSFIGNDGFSKIKNSAEFRELAEKYTPKITIWSFLYLYVALIGFYIAVVINFNRKIDTAAKILISGFIFIHSFFILHICLNITNYQFEFPHSYLMSTVFSFLYGPLLYFYFKRISEQYRFKKSDLWHLAPTLLFLIYIIPIYALPAHDKLTIMLEQLNNGLGPSDSRHLTIIVLLKLISLMIYGYYIRKVYLKSKNNGEISSPNKSWQKNIFQLHIFYIITYAIYGILIANQISFGFFYHTPIVFMALMVLYVGYSANVQPLVFSGIYALDNRLFYKYEKSGLTKSLSKELMEQIIWLFDTEKIYKESDISLELLAAKLNTTRHNASQVINEHFKVSFYELVNKYRIQEAKEILNQDSQKNLNIIDVAYEVGYNNKVTFNKAFKKDTNLTPSEYQKLSIIT